MHCQQLRIRIAFSCFSLVLLGSSVGCQSLDTELSMLFGDDPPPAAAQQPQPAAQPSGQKFYVEFREDGRKPTLLAMPLTDVTYVQQALEQSGAIKKFRRAKIELYRQLPQGGGHKLPVEFDRNNRRVPPGSDYALHPDDRIVVTEDNSTVLDDMLDRLGGGSGATKALGN